MTNLVYEWEQDGLKITFRWLGDVDVHVEGVYALPFTSDGRILLVTNDDWKPKCWLPGGGVLEGETPEQALDRELSEAGATLDQHQKLGVQQSTDSSGLVEHQVFFWCRVSINSNFVPRKPGLECHLVEPDRFLDTLYWGRADPKAPMLLEEALRLQEGYGSAV